VGRVSAERPLRVVYEGRTDGVRYGSWALVNQRLLGALLAVPAVDVEVVDPGQEPSGDAPVPDVWLSHFYPGLEPLRCWVPPLPVLGAGGPPWVPWVAWEHGRPPLDWTDAWALGRPAEVWACSEHARRLLLAGSDLDPARVRAVPYGVDTGLFAPEGPRWRTRRAERGVFRVLYVGGAVARKGADLALEAYCRAFLPDEPTRLVLKIQGLRSFYESAPAIGAPDGRTDWGLLTSDDYTDAQMAGLYRSVDVVLQPYRAEGFCLPLLEAMACGVPVVYPAHGPAPEYVPEGAGICVGSAHRVADPDALARALRWLWRHPDERARMGRIGRAAALGLSWERRAQVIVAALREVASRAVGARVEAGGAG
jgi:glycosyltransferase involved in cell wall biosynthesis